jgi:uncharacterized surface protein with fasciclin (FAS1) repeats
MKHYKFLVIATALSAGALHASNCQPVKDAATYYRSQLTTVFDLAKGTKLEKVFNDTSKSANPITLFLPTNSAFRKLPTGVTEAVTNSTSLRETVLLDHAIKGRVGYIKFLSIFNELPRITSGLTSNYLEKAGFPQSLNTGDFFFGGRALRTGGTNLISTTELNWGSAESGFRGSFRDGSATLVGVDYESCAGIVHVIDTVITRKSDEH